MKEINKQKIKYFFVFGIILVILIAGIIHYTYAVDTYITITSPTSNEAYFNNFKLLNTDAPDPSFISYNNNYYLYSTGHKSTKSGIRLFKSSDFKNWKKVSDGVSNNESGCNDYWAPEIYKYNSKFYLFYTCYVDSSNKTIWVSEANTPDGPFNNAKKINSQVPSPAIDANVLFDTDGKIYLYTKQEIPQTGTPYDPYVVDTYIYVEELNKDFTVNTSVSPKQLLTIANKKYFNIGLDDNYWEREQIEGQYVMKKGNTYYLMYSTGIMGDYTYTIGYATSNSPTGPFTRVTIGDNENSTSSLLHGVIPTKDANGTYLYDSNKNIYSTGHHSIYTVSDNEMYIVYHSGVFDNNQFKYRRFYFDYIGIDSNGKLYVNGPSKTNQPLPSGALDLYRLNNNEYNVLVDNKSNASLKDFINYNVLNTANNMNKTPLTKCNTVNTSSIKINLTKGKNIEDIWLFGTSTGFSNITANVILNDKYILKNVSLGTSGTAKIQLPNMPEYVKNIQIDFSNSTILSEVDLYSKKELLGDVNNDNVLNSKDVYEIARYIIDGKTNNDYIIRGDMNGDGKIKMNDVMKLIKLLYK